MGTSCYFTFPTTYNAIRAEKILQTSSCHYRMVPVPRTISSSCGTALRCSCDDIEKIKALLGNHQIDYEQIHEVKEENKDFSFSNFFKKRKKPDEQ